MIVNEDVNDLLTQFQNDQLKDIQEKLEDKPTREEIERMMQKLSDAVEVILSRFDEFKDLGISGLKGEFVNNNIYLYTVNYILNWHSVRMNWIELTFG